MKQTSIQYILKKAKPIEKGGSIVKLKNSYDGLEKVSDIALAIIAGAGIITLSAVAPNLIFAVGKLLKRNRKSNNPKHSEQTQQAARTVYYLKRHGFIDIKPDGNDYLVTLTKLGLRKAKTLNIKDISIPKPKKWQNTWWLAAADIPTKHHRHEADLLRRKLKSLNFYPLQRTLWLYPYDPRTELDFILHYYHIEQFVTLMEIKRLDQEDELNAIKFFKECNLS